MKTEFHGKEFFIGELSPLQYKENQIQAAIGWEITREEDRAETLSINKLFSNIDRKLKILDIGFGFGRSLKVFEEMGFNNVTGVDISKEKIEKIKSKFSSVYCCDANKLPFQDNKFDIIYSSHSFEHMFDPFLTILELIRVLNSNGKIFIIIPYPDSGPFYIHCASISMGLNLLDKGETCKKWFLDLPLKVDAFEIFEEIDNIHRQPEVWVSLSIDGLK